LRRLSLAGQQLSQFSGPTADGGFISADEFPGKPTLIYFWESDSQEFSEGLLPVLNKIRSQWPSDQLRIVGVALDEDESSLNSFMEMNEVPGQQIFFPNAQQRSWDSPLIRFWGVARTPSVWLVDANGKVVSTTATTKSTLKELQSILKP
jgi:thiol-disulfide isomerase/thioredoxin